MTQGIVRDDEFKTFEIEPGITFRYLPVSKWKTLSIDVFCKVPITRERVTALALIPRLARRGTVSLPTLRDLSRSLEQMYGASMNTDARKIGPVQVLRFGMDLPSPEFLDPAAFGTLDGVNLGKALSFVWDVVTRPYLENDAYPLDRFEVEREEHRRDILGLINNRPHYATVRLVEELSKGDPRGLPAWGILEELDALDPKRTWDIWRETLSRCSVSIYAVGEGAEECGEILTRSKLFFPEPRVSDRLWDIDEELEAPPLPPGILRSTEELPGEQTILCMAFYTGVTEKDPRLPALLFFDGILGGFPHSKLFRTVREREGLAYFADTVPNTWRGLVLAIAGLDGKKISSAEALILEQVESMKRGEITREEIENTRAGLLRRYRSESDSQEALIRRFLTQEVLGGPASEEEIISRILKVTKDDIVEVSQKAELKAVYVLDARKGDG